MPDPIQIRGGPKASMPALAPREPGYVTDARELHIGTGAGNVMVAKAGVPFITAQTPAASAANGTIFEDTDGALKYKNLAGVVTTL